MTAVFAALAIVFAGTSLASGGTFNWNGVNGQDACAPGTTGTILWIFNPHSDAVPTSLTITWSDGTTVTYTGDWTNPGNGQNWHDTETIVGEFPPQSASLTYTGTLGKDPILTISGCNEGGPPPAPGPTVSKTAGQDADTEFAWTITKNVNTNEIDTPPGGTATFHYTVKLKGVGTTTIGDLSGIITAYNNAGGDITLATLSDQLSDGTNCTIDTTGDPSLTIPANGFQDFPYSCSLTGYPADYPNTHNTVTMTWNGQDLSDGSHLPAGQASYSVPVVFTTSVSDNCATATDEFNGGTPDPLGTYCSDTGTADTSLVTLPNFTVVYHPPTWTIKYTRTLNASPSGTCIKYENEAEFADNSTPQHTGSAETYVSVCTGNAPQLIGYWMRHLAPNGTPGCTPLPSGTGCSLTGPWTNQYLPQSLGNYSVSTFQLAASVFSANKCAQASSSSQNAVSCLAAQLLAAELNVAHGSDSCIATAHDGTNDASGWLAGLTVDGVAGITYTGPTGNYHGLTVAQRNEALALKGVLLNYNAGGGC
ncbi:MAG: hypothetical protein ACJ75G_08350 [Gaiellaceae bacterium]